MCANDTVEAVAGELDSDVLVARPETTDNKGSTEDSRSHVDEIGNTTAFSEAASDAGVVVVAVDAASVDVGAMVETLDGTDGFVVAVFGAGDTDTVDPSSLAAVGEAVDVSLLACENPCRNATRQGAARESWQQTQPAPAVDGALRFVQMTNEPGRINLDLADARTVLTDRSQAVLCGGTASLTAGAEQAVRRGFEATPPSVDVATGSGALVSVTGGPALSIGDATAAVREVRSYVGGMDELIWGVTIDDTLSGQVTADVVVDNITRQPPLSAGDPCRRCGAALTTYALGERTTLACESCGFADLSTDLGKPDHDVTPLRDNS